MVGRRTVPEPHSVLNSYTVDCCSSLCSLVTTRRNSRAETADGKVS